MNKADDRRNKQLNFLACGEEIEAGDINKLPIDIYDLMKIDVYSEYVESHIDSGLTADIFKLKINDAYFTLKKKREEILVKNIDGQTSFLNEVQRRGDFEKLKKSDPASYAGIVDTTYASLNKGIILSPWIEGCPVKKYTGEIIENLFHTLYYIEIAGLFEYDLCSGNLLLQNDGTVRLFDFGYMYPYDPLKDYNPDGKDFPMFHCAERFESRNYMQYLMNIEDEIGMDIALYEYRSEKEIALKYSIKKLQWLKENNADNDVINWTGKIIELWKNGLDNQNNLGKLYDMESFRSYILDIHDDLGGKSCTHDTVMKVKKVLSKIETNYDFLNENHGLFWGDEKLTCPELLNKYRDIQKLVNKYQIRNEAS